ncbi:hypothetical protein [Campylobacter hominis]|uniref:CRISPR-associated protein Csh1 n=1 Tax=Campylobacter hominis (strain ATCC BAA-381 / DSM 21671 / CCUG 45161 / LMG 19568 / NCTC 13146 / CH001A) TaxID=360107 RepID=A7I0F7_CAMHC|nr:hypothetical protein [Campylobacter hominis]ABS51692.1 conserved hypothetical protein [Campylobacter hominis ATCC BAA-381]UAK85166.1 hypothetical protein K8O82_04615 [Campylobacter hominis]SUW84546.1 Uncharacterised protein [Campylobacter hominis]
MKKDLIERFNETPNLVLDSYTLKSGIYIKLGEKYVQKFIVKQEKSKNDLYKENGDKVVEEDKKWFKKNDYLSVYLDSNKSVFDKKFHNANFLTLFFKIENFGYIVENLNKNFEVFRTFEKFNKKEDKIIIENQKEYINSKERQEKINKAEKLIKNYLDEIKKFADEKIKNGQYVRIFIDEADEIYEKESQIYTELKIFNANSYNKLINGKIYGLSNSNTGMNSKKPFLKHKSRKSILPSMISQKEALDEKSFFDWLSYQNRNFIDNFDNAFLLKFNENGRAVISDFESIVFKEKSSFKIEIVDFIDAGLDLYEINNKNAKAKIDEVLYQKSLSDNNLFSNEIKINDKILKELIYQTRNSVIELLYKNNEADFYQMVNKYSSDFIKVALRSCKEYGELNAKKAINFILSLKDYKGETVDLDTIKENLENALKSDITKLDSNEYFFLAGQIAKYLMSKSKAANKTYALAEPYLKAKTTNKLKSVLKNEFERYKYEISIYDKRFNKAYLLIQNSDDIQINNDFESLMLAGMMSQNLIYDNKKGESDE